jgi:hypothetical protein
MTLSEIHGQLGNMALIYMVIVSLWAYVRFFRRQGIDSSFWGALAIAEFLLVAQLLVGIYLWTQGFRPPRAIHVLYGFLIPVMIPGAYYYTRGRVGRPEALVYGTTTIITVGLIFRAIFTGDISL